MSQEQRRIRPDTPVSSEAVIEQTSSLSEMDSVIRSRMEEILDIRDVLTKTQEENLKKQEELSRRELEREYREQRLALKEEEIRKSLGDDMSGFRGFERTDPPVDSPVPLPLTPSSSRHISPTTAPRRSTITPLPEGEIELKREIEDLRRKIREMRTMALFAPLPNLLQSSFKLRELIDYVPKFDGQNVSVTQIIRVCRRAFKSVPAGFSTEMKTSLTRLFLSKLSGHAYLLAEGLRISRVKHLIERLKDAFLPSRGSNYYREQLAELMRPGVHIIDYFGRIKELTQSVLDKTTKNSVRVERRVKLAIEKEGLDALIRGLPWDYKTALKFEYYSNFDEILICLLRIDKQIKGEDSKMGISMAKNRVANIKPINKSINCGYSKKDGHFEDSCWEKKGYPFSSKPGPKSSSKPKSLTKSESSPKRKIPIKKCQYCKNFGHLILECRKPKYKIENLNSGNLRGEAAKVTSRSPPLKERPKSPAQRPGPSGLKKKNIIQSGSLLVSQLETKDNQTDDEDSDIEIDIDNTNVLDKAAGEIDYLTGSLCALTDMGKTGDVCSDTGNSVLRGYALHTVYGLSVHLIGAIWGFLTNLLLHMKNTKSGKSTRPQAEATELIEITTGRPEDKNDNGDNAQASTAASASQTDPPGAGSSSPDP
ncbi:hypothetical protein M0804_014632 [Polistes exclamans]|nr:hypothetical protein M0804_014632 [Polistes exclamans]